MPRHLHKSWKPEDWPAAERQAWTAALKKGDIFEDSGGASHWRDSTATTVGRSYGHWLKWTAETGVLHADGGVAHVVTPEYVARYVAHLRDTVSSSTAASRLLHIYMAVKAMAPESDWRWLHDLWKRLERRAVPLRNKNERLADAADLLACGMQAMEDADKSAGLCLRERAILYRDGLLVALLIARPLRLANLTQIEIGRHLVRRRTGYRLIFAAEETKTRQPID
jgi:integrase/recombinase XerD